MKQRQIVKIDEKEIALKELSVAELLYLCHRSGWVGDVAGIDFELQFAKQKSMALPDLILSFVSDISKEEVIVLAPSEIKKLYDSFMEVNKVTFTAAKYFGVDRIIEEMKTELVKVFTSIYSTEGIAGIVEGKIVKK